MPRFPQTLPPSSNSVRAASAEDVSSTGSGSTAGGGAAGDSSGVPWYLADVYTWAYLSRFGTRFFDRQTVVTTILWGNAGRLIRWALAEVPVGSHVLQPAAVYGTFSRQLAQQIGPNGRLEVSDVAPVQVDLTRRKLADLSNASVYRWDATQGGRGPYQAIVCFFLLHEVPDPIKQQVVRRLLDSVEVGGKVVFVDYHRPAAWHPLRPVMKRIFARLEPFAPSLWQHEIEQFADQPTRFSWQKETLFGGLYQKVVAERTA